MNSRDVQPMMVALISFIIAIAATNLIICILNSICYVTKFNHKIWESIDEKDKIIQLKGEILATSILGGLQVLYCVILGLLLYCLGEKFCLHITAAVFAVFTLIGVIIILSFTVDHTKSSQKKIIESSLRKVVYNYSINSNEVSQWRSEHNCENNQTDECDNQIRKYVSKNLNDIRVMNMVPLILIVLLIVGIIISCILLSTIRPKSATHQEVAQPLEGIDDSESDDLDRIPASKEQTDAEKSRNNA